ncbi:GNAT family N-acetyltransferase [Streptomyces apocyni]|uniref:GNAT family N-acetyltransferase n=1 Tax=Streptomyces apocyni TaxID=2654677 RepID=UPI0012EABF32|nr:GNAT family N-acetyltransferase [Streptomyces apocyni]
MEIRRAQTTDELLAATHLFDTPVRPEWAQRFLDAAGHHLLLAYDGEGDGEGATPVGFVSGIELVHPDKGTEMCLYELGVDEAFRRRGIGRALVATLEGLARERGCYDMWVGVEPDNEAALATYRSAGGKDDAAFAMVLWEFPHGAFTS